MFVRGLGGGGCATQVAQSVALLRNGAHFMRPPPPSLGG